MPPLATSSRHGSRPYGSEPPSPASADGDGRDAENRAGRERVCVGGGRAQITALSQSSHIKLLTLALLEFAAVDAAPVLSSYDAILNHAVDVVMRLQVHNGGVEYAAAWTCAAYAGAGRCRTLTLLLRWRGRGFCMWRSMILYVEDDAEPDDLFLLQNTLDHGRRCAQLKDDPVYSVQLLGAFRRAVQAAMATFGDRFATIMATVERDTAIQVQTLLTMPETPRVQ